MKIDVDINSSLIDNAEALACVTRKEQQKLISAATDALGTYECMALGDFIHCLNGDFSCILCGNNDVTIAQYYWTIGFHKYTQEFAKALERMQIDPTADEKRAASANLELDFEQATLIFCKEYFGLHNFDISGIHVWEYLLAKKDAYNTAIYRKRYDTILTNKYKLKK